MLPYSYQSHPEPPMHLHLNHSSFIHSPLKSTYGWKTPGSPTCQKTGFRAPEPASHNLHSLPSPVSPNKPCSPSERATDSKPNTLPTPRPSLEPELPTRSQILSLDEVKSKIKPFLDHTSVVNGSEMLIEGVTPDLVEELLATSRAGQLPGWEKLRIDFAGERLIVRYPTFGHEIMSALFVKLAQDSPELPPFYSITHLGGSTGSTLYTGGSANVKLEDGIKSPDFSLYEEHPDEELIMKAWPTVVWEVGYTEHEGKLAEDVGRFVACSLGRVQLAIGVKIEHDRAKRGHPRGPLKKVTCAFWEVDDIEEFTTLEEAGSPLHYLTRCDGVVDDGRVMPPATRFFCVSKVQETYVKFYASQHDVYTIFPEDPTAPKALSILRRHLYRTVSEVDEDQPAITIPFSMIRQIIEAHESRQRFLDSSGHYDNKKKRPREGEENNSKVLLEHIRRKKSRVAESTSKPNV